MGTLSKHEAVVITFLFEGRSNGFVAGRPIELGIDPSQNIAGPVLLKDSNRPSLTFADNLRVRATASNIYKAAIEGKNLAKLIGPLPRCGKRADASATTAGES